jgi:signal transduction histidine kinase
MPSSSINSVFTRSSRRLGGGDSPCSLAILLASLLATAPSRAAELEVGHWLASRLSENFVTTERRLGEIAAELQTLPVMPDLDALGTHGFHSNFTGDSEGNWFEISWDQPQRIDGLAMIPTRLSTQSGRRSNYGLPNRMRIEALLPGATGRVVLAEIDDTRLDLRRGDPVFLELAAVEVVALRFVPIDLPTLPGKTVRFFSLAELMVFDGPENIAGEGRFNASFTIDTEVGWNIGYLVDGQSPLGPAEMPEPGHSLGWHGDPVQNDLIPTWAQIDLGEARDFDAIRIIAARGDAPIKGPGFGFPVWFRLEVSDDPAAGPWTTLWDTGTRDFPNPGYNPVNFRFTPARGRFVRLTAMKLHQPDHFTTPRVLLSELEVLHDGHNIALGKKVDTPDRAESIPHDAKRVWSRAGLTDGYSSTGRLISGRQWVSQLSRRFDLLCEQQALSQLRNGLIDRHHRVFLFVCFGSLFATVLGLAVWQVRTRLASRRQVARLRRRISSDLHDEVGSTLATIALLSDLPPAPGTLGEINRLARESSESLREIVEITLAPGRLRKPLGERLRDIASVMLRDHRWTFEGGEVPELHLEQRRNLVFFFKEALHNILRHAQATEVEIRFQKKRETLELSIHDNGCGMEPGPSNVGGGLHTLYQRAESLRGDLEVDSRPGGGTRLVLRFSPVSLSAK